MEAWREELYDSELYHYGILGMKWGVRRYQNPDGTLTDAGKKHYSSGTSPEGKKKKNSQAKATAKVVAKTGLGLGIGAALIGGAGAAANKNPNLFERNIQSGKGKEKKSPIESGASEVERGFGSATNAAKTLSALKAKEANEQHVTLYDNDLSKKSDEQLRKEIDRMRLETQWDELNNKQIARGRAEAADYLEAAAQIAAVTTSAATVAALIYKIKHGGA